MTHRDRRNATEDAAHDLAAHYGRFCNRARAEAEASTTCLPVCPGRRRQVEHEPVEIDPQVAVRVAAIMAQLRKRP